MAPSRRANRDSNGLCAIDKLRASLKWSVLKMAHFLIYLPNGKTQSPKLLEDVGLAHLIAGAEFLESVGPDGGRGMLLAWRRPDTDPRFNFDPAIQTWIAATLDGELPAKRYFVGWFNDSPPRPAEMKRPDFLAGNWVKLGDGESWLVPCIRDLPLIFVRREDGRLDLGPQPRHQSFYDKTEEVHSLFSAGRSGLAEATTPFFRLAEFAEFTLSMNYRIVREIFYERQLFTTDNVQQVFYAAIGAQADLISAG
jgi:hypothetical protein